MPNLDTTLHLDMLNAGRRRPRLPRRLYRAVKKALRPVYGLEWGDLEDVPPLAYVLDHFVRHYVNGDHTAVEIGPGGGRWTQHLTGFGKLYAVDYHDELLLELKKNFGAYGNIEFVRNNGSDFPGIPAGSVDFLFSFGTFVHLEFSIIADYLRNIHPILKAGGQVVLQYSDKTKIMGKENVGFSENSPQRMRDIVLALNYRILEEDLTTLWHSSVIRFTK